MIRKTAKAIEQYYEPRLKSYKEAVKKLGDEHDQLVLKATEDKDKKIKELEDEITCMHQDNAGIDI